jgi:2-isopropylmalate synthase
LQTAGVQVQVRSFEERSIKASQQAGDAQACAFVELAVEGERTERYGVGLDSNIVTASLQALISGVNRLGLQLAVKGAELEGAAA